MITFFTIPRPFSGLHDTIQKNSILSLKKLRPKCEILLFSNDSSVIEFSKENNIQCIDTFNSNSYGTPLLDGIWETAGRVSSNDLVCYINSDIILFSEFLVEVKKLKFDQFLLEA